VSPTRYEPDGVGWLGLDTLTGYTPAEMRAVPTLDVDQMGAYLSESAIALVETFDRLRDHLHAGGPPTPYQAISNTLQGSFGHIGEIDALVSWRARLSAAPTFPGISSRTRRQTGRATPSLRAPAASRPERCPRG